MILIILLILFVFGIGIGIYLLTKKDKKRVLEDERLLSIKTKLADTTRFIVYTECDYKGDEMEIVTEKGHQGVLSFPEPSIRSLIIPNGINIVAYSGPDKTGISEKEGGP